MKITLGLALYALAVVCVRPEAGQAGQMPLALTTDPVADAQYPASMVEESLVSHGSKMNSVFYLASGAQPHGTVLLLHGFPGFEQNLDLAQAIRRAGWHVLVPRYRGAWGSQGQFSFRHATEDVQAALAFLREPHNVRAFRIDAKRIVLAGHSMGGFMAAYGASQDPGVAGLAMFAAWNIGTSVGRVAPGKEKSYVDGLRKGLDVSLAGCTAEGLFAEAKEHAQQWDYTKYAAALKSLPVLVVETDDGNREENRAFVRALGGAGNARVSEIHLPSDHGFSDHRLALEAGVVNWLQQMLPPMANRVLP
jgi:uncharacterized protein